jgi:hypothetical protein
MSSRVPPIYQWLRKGSVVLPFLFLCSSCQRVERCANCGSATHHFSNRIEERWGGRTWCGSGCFKANVKKNCWEVIMEKDKTLYYRKSLKVE